MIQKTHKVISSLSNEACTQHAVFILDGGSTPTPASTAYPSANRAIYVPFRIHEPLLVQKLWCRNGATASGNLDIGIYSVDGTRIVSSGSTAGAGSNVLQEFDITDTTLAAGKYYFGLACDNTVKIGPSARKGAGVRMIPRILGMLVSFFQARRLQLSWQHF